MSTEEITIQGQTYKVPLRYKGGDILKDNEAVALNQLLHNNLRNNFSQKVNKARKAANGADPDYAKLQADLDEFAARYEFGMRAGGKTSTATDPAEHRALVSAKDIVRRAAKEKQLQWTVAQIEEAAHQLLAKQGPQGPLITAARAQVEAEKSVAADMLASVVPAAA